MCCGSSQVASCRQLALFQTRKIISRKKLMKKCLIMSVRIRSNFLKKDKRLLINNSHFLIILTKTLKFQRKSKEAQVQSANKKIITTNTHLIRNKAHMSDPFLHQYQLIYKEVERKGRKAKKEKEDNRIALISINNRVY